MKSIPVIQPIETRLRQINPRLMELVQLELSGRISPKRKAELDALCNALETGQEFGPDRATHEPNPEAVSALRVGVTGKEGEVN